MAMHRHVRLAGILALAVLIAVSGGCKRGKKKVIEPGLTGQGATSQTEETTSGPELPQIDPTKLNWQPAADLEKVYFDYDQFTLRPDAINTLNANAQKMKTDPANVMWQIEGHCDERGTQEYNLALGEKRALAVREYLMKVGIPGDRMITISYGEERPERDGHDESAWKYNRRCAFNRATR